MRHDTRLSSAVPHSTAFLPPAFIATLPPMHEASAEVGSTANTSPALSAASMTRLVTTPAPQRIVGTLCSTPGEPRHLDRAERLELLGVDHRGVLHQRHRAAGVAGAAAARDDREPELDAVAHDRRHLLLVVGRDHDERVLDAPVGGVGDVRDAREAVELDVVAARAAREPAHGPLAEPRRFLELTGEALDRGARALEQEADLRVACLELRADGRVTVARGVGRVPIAPLLDLPSRWWRASISAARRFGFSSRSSWRYGLRETTQMSPSTSYSMRAERPVRRSARSSRSACHASSPSRRMTISRSENEV